MKNIPKRIYLQIDADGETPENFNELSGISWCDERMHPNDIEFILNGNTEKREKEVSCFSCEHRDVSMNIKPCYGCGHYKNHKAR